MGRKRNDRTQFGNRVKAFFFLLLVGACVWVYNGPFENWSENHPSVFHNCHMKAVLCQSGTAAWISNGYSVPLYGKCACTASLHVGINSN